MLISHIHDALGQVRRLQAFILERQTFRGYSGVARMGGGIMALSGAWAMSRPGFPATPRAHLLGWAAVLGAALLLNYGGLLMWFLRSPQAGRRPASLTPAVDALPALAVGALLSLVAVQAGQYEWLFGLWMCLYGLVHATYRRSLPMGNYGVGLFYLAAGAVCLLAPDPRFTNPWPMGLTFFAGEMTGGVIFCRIPPLDAAEETP